MHKFVFAIAALAIAGFAAPTVQSANAETVVIKKHRDHDRDWGRHHRRKVVIIKHRDRDHGHHHHRDHDHD